MSDRRQKALALSNAQKFAALRAIDRLALSPTPGARIWRNVVELIVQVQLTSGRGPCDKEVAVLAGRMFQGTGVSRATVFRAANVAEDHGLLGRTQRVTGRGQQANVWRIDWDRIVALSKLDAEALGEPQPCPPIEPLDKPVSVEPESQFPVPEYQSQEPASQLGSRVADSDGGRVSLRRGVSQSATPLRGTNKGLTREEQPPPPNPSPGNAWRREEEALLRLGMRGARAAVAAAEAAGCLVEHWIPHREYWERHRQRWRSPLGVLAHRLGTLRPNQPPSEGWPPGDPAAEAAERQAAANEKYDREKGARRLWREAGDEERLRILGLAGQQGTDAMSLLKEHPSDAERLAIAFVAPRLRRSSSTAAPAGVASPHES